MDGSALGAGVLVDEFGEEGRDHLDVDLAVQSIRQPEAFPLIAKS
jgi:hypothetical protein